MNWFLIILGWLYLIAAVEIAVLGRVRQRGAWRAYAYILSASALAGGSFLMFVGFNVIVIN
jgi:hypothetical protein